MSIRRQPGWYGRPARWPSANTARRTRRTAVIRRIWPRQWCLRIRTAVRRSTVMLCVNDIAITSCISGHSPLKQQHTRNTSLSRSQTSHTHNTGHHIVEVAGKLFTDVAPDTAVVRPIDRVLSLHWSGQLGYACDDGCFNC